MTDEWTDVLNLYEDEWEKSIRQLPLSDETCEQLLDCYFMDGCKNTYPAFLHICVNPPDEKGECGVNERGEKEQLKVTNERKWCKNRGLQMGSPYEKKGERIEQKKFRKDAKKILKSLKDSRNAQRERSQMLSNEEKEEIKDGIDSLERVASFEEIQARLDELKSIPIENLPSEDELFERLHKLKFDERKKITRNLQDKKARLEAGMQTIVLVRDSSQHMVEEISQGMINRQNQDTNDEKYEVKRSNIDTATSVALDDLVLTINKLNDKLGNLQQQVQQINDKQDIVINTTDSIRDQQKLQEYANLWYKSKWGVFKTILSAPLQALNIIVWRPAMYAFWTFFGRWAYLLWGLLMLLLIIVVTMSIFTMINYYIPELFPMFYEVAIKLWGVCLRSGSVVAQWLKPWFGESLNLLVENGKAGMFKVASLLYDWTIGFLIEIFKSALAGVGTGVTNMVGYLFS